MKVTFEIEVIPIEEDDSSYDQGEHGSLCFKIDKNGMFDGIYFGVQGDGRDKWGEPLVPEWCNYCIRLPWGKINEAINQKIKEVRNKAEKKEIADEKR